MALESLTGSSVYIDDLVNTNPTGSDVKSQGDDHIRGIKNVLLNTFPNISGAVLSNQTELNLLDGKDASHLLTAGRKMVFYEASAPTGWTQVTGINDKMLRAVDGTGAGSGGDWQLSGITVASHTLTIDEMPAHDHSIQVSFIGSGDSSNGGYVVNSISSPNRTTTQVGGGNAHSHNVTLGNTWRPAYIDIIVCTKD